MFADLTETNWIGAWNALPDTNFILTGDNFKIPVKCFCGDPNVSLSYGLFLTYVVAAGARGNLSGLASDFNTSEALLRKYNPSVNWNGSKVDQYAFIPVKGANFTFSQLLIILFFVFFFSWSLSCEAREPARSDIIVASAFPDSFICM